MTGLVFCLVTLGLAVMRPEVRRTPHTCRRPRPRLVTFTQSSRPWSSLSSLWTQPVWAMLLGWSLTPHPAEGVLQQESGTFRPSLVLVQPLVTQSW